MHPRPIACPAGSARRRKLSSEEVWNRNVLQRICANAIHAEYGATELLALPVNDTEEGYRYPRADPIRAFPRRF